MTLKKFNKTENLVHNLIIPITDEMHLDIWDIAFEKQGSEWFLTVLIDNSVDMDTCEKLSRKISEKLDETDPIPQSYILEVGSAGLERELLTDKHITAFLNQNVFVKLIRPIDEDVKTDKSENGVKKSPKNKTVNKIKEITDKLVSFDEEKIKIGNKEISLKDISKIKSIMEEFK
ncbi:MAG: ribosome maturation factor RimP [Ruminococcus sp.]|jgi:ribosome maturation factor RimP|nr:ribosome maturation factor RimP [Ruminococcus sp.]